MPLAPTDLAALSGLLDEALDLTPSEFEAWLSALPAEHRHLLPRLRDMLAEHSSESECGFLADGPKLSGDAIDETTAHIDDLIGPYRLIREIGHGGMGTVWLAERADRTLKRKVALKLPRLAWGSGLAERMARERDIGALLEHPNIARLYDAGVDAKGRPYLALEYIDGQQIDDWCKEQALGIRPRLKLFVQVVRAVAYAHGRLVVHRDIKPSNVLVTADGQAHLLDFGIAKLLHEAGPDDEQLTQMQGQLLTPHYASPEQINGGTITVASDVYSLGVLLYELLTRKTPHAFERKSLGAIEQAILENDAAVASSRTDDPALAKALRGELDAILAKALKRDPTQRYATADAMADDIVRHIDGERVLARPDTMAYRFTKTLHKHRTGFVAAGVMLITVLSGAGLSLVQAQRANDAAERARVVKEFIVDVFKVNERSTQGEIALREMPAEALLERGAGLIEAKFPGQPALQAELYGVVSGIFYDMGSDDLAVSYALRQVEARATLGASDTEQARANVLLAQGLCGSGRWQEALIRGRRAKELSHSDSALRLQSVVLLAQVLERLGRFDEATPLIAEAEMRLRRISPPTVEGAKIKWVRAMMLVALNHLDQGLPILESAIDEALAAEGPLSRTAIQIRGVVAGKLFEVERNAEARRYADAQLTAMRAIGGPADIRAAGEEMSYVDFMFRNAVIPFDEARSMLERDRALLAGRKVVPKNDLVWADRWLGYLYLNWGEPARAQPLLESSYALLGPAAAKQSSDSWFFLFQANLAMMIGNHIEADEMLKRQIQHETNFGGANNPWAMYPFVKRALNFSMASRYDEAENVLASTPPAQQWQGGTTTSKDLFVYLVNRMRARIRIDRGNAVSAFAALPPEETDDPARDPEFGYDHRLRGEILCELGERKKGLELIDDTLTRQKARFYEHHPDLARARAIAGLCALADGQRKRAQELAALARASLITQPNVSPYYKHPSERLDRLLAAKVATR